MPQSVSNRVTGIKRSESLSMATSIELSTEVERWLISLANRTVRTKDYYVQQVISWGLEKVEDYYLASQGLERVRQGEDPVFSSAEARKHLGLED